MDNTSLYCEPAVVTVFAQLCQVWACVGPELQFPVSAHLSLLGGWAVNKQITGVLTIDWPDSQNEPITQSSSGSGWSLCAQMEFRTLQETDSVTQMIKKKQCSYELHSMKRNQFTITSV